MSMTMRPSHRVGAALLAAVGIWCAVVAVGPGISAAASHGTVPLAAMDPSSGGASGQPVVTGQPVITAFPVITGVPRFPPPTSTSSGAPAGAVTADTTTDGDTTGSTVVPAVPAASATTDRDRGLVTIAIGSSTLAAALAALVLIGWLRDRRYATDRRPDTATAPVIRPTVIKDEPYRPRHRLPRR